MTMGALPMTANIMNKRVEQETTSTRINPNVATEAEKKGALVFSSKLKPVTAA